jgi:hypothetical protein
LDALSTHEKAFTLIAGRGHNDVSNAPSYWEAIASFIDRIKKRPRANV